MNKLFTKSFIFNFKMYCYLFLLTSTVLLKIVNFINSFVISKLYCVKMNKVLRTLSYQSIELKLILRI